MCPIGEYVPDFNERILEPADLPQPEIVLQNRSFKKLPCPKCLSKAPRVRDYQREFHELGDPIRQKPRDVQLTYSQHQCRKCHYYFHEDFNDLVLPYSQYSAKVVQMAIRLVVEDGLPYGEARWHLWRDHFVWVPRGTVQNWVEGAGKKSCQAAEDICLDDALKDFSGYIAIDEVYDGPFCILSIVDNRRFHRLLLEVLDHSPKHADIIAFLTRFKQKLADRHLALRGVTTDASPLYPEPLRVLFPGIPHQICRFHLIKEITRAILKGLAKVRRDLGKTIPKVRRGRAGKDPAERSARRKKKRIEAKIAELFENRFLLVKRNLTPAEERALIRMTRGFPDLRLFRAIMDQVYSLFDRRCRMKTALKKLAKLREQAGKLRKVYSALGKLFSGNLEKGLVFLDEKLLPSTSNAVERGNRRFRKMQKTVYRVRTLKSIRERIALDMMREAKFRHRLNVLGFLKGFRHG